MCRKIHIAEGLQFGRFACCFSVDRRVENLPLVLFPRKGKVSECQHKGHVPPPPSPTFFVSAPYHITDPPHFRFFKFFSFLFFSYPCSDYFGFKAVYFEGTNAAEIADAEDKKNMVQMKELYPILPRGIIVYCCVCLLYLQFLFSSHYASCLRCLNDSCFPLRFWLLTKFRNTR